VAGPGGTEQIYGFDVEASKYWRLPWDIILLVNAEVAGVDRWGDQTKLVKIYDRLFLGGSNNLRGFRFSAMSAPKIVTANRSADKAWHEQPIEFTFPIVEKARGALIL
jgi:outer membrane protein insertion porin family